MSTIAYASITSARERAPAGASKNNAPPGIKTYIDALAALVPAEVLTAHGLIMSYAVTGKTGSDGPASALRTTTIPVEASTTLIFAFWFLFVSAAALYFFSKRSSGQWKGWDWMRTMIAPFAFLAWTMLQPTTAFDAAFHSVTTLQRNVFGILIAAVLTVLATWLAGVADKTDPAKT